MSSITLQQFYKELEEHDWTYNHSDDQRAWRAGRLKQRQLDQWAALSDKHTALYWAYKDHIFKKAPKPPQP